MKYDDAIQTEGEHVLAFGDPGTGKSTQAALLAQYFNLIWVSGDNGHKVIGKLPKELRDKIDIIICPDTKDFPVFANTCLRLITGAKIKICHAHGQVLCTVCLSRSAPFSDYEMNKTPLNTIWIFDHLTRLADSVTADMTKNKADDYKMEWDDWRKQGSFLVKFLMNVQHSTANILCLAHTIEVMMENDAKKLAPYCGTREFSRTVGGYFDHVACMEVLNKSHRAGSSTTYSMSALTKSRSDVAIENFLKDHPNDPWFYPLFAEALSKYKPVTPGEEPTIVLPVLDTTVKSNVAVDAQRARATELLKGLKGK